MLFYLQAIDGDARKQCYGSYTSWQCGQHGKILWCPFNLFIPSPGIIKEFRSKAFATRGFYGICRNTTEQRRNLDPNFVKAKLPDGIVGTGGLTKNFEIIPRKPWPPPIKSEIAPSKNALHCSRVHLWDQFILSRRVLIKAEFQVIFFLLILSVTSIVFQGSVE